jgi:hypothetical protein
MLGCAFRECCAVSPHRVLASSSQLRRRSSLRFAGWWLSLARQLLFVFEVRDLWPESRAALFSTTLASRYGKAASGQFTHKSAVGRDPMKLKNAERDLSRGTLPVEAE